MTSAGAGDGKTLTALNLAVTLATQDMRVVLVDGDFRRPMVGSIFGVAAPRDGFAKAFIRGNVRSAMVDAPGHANLKLMLPTLHDMTQIDQLDTDRVAQMYDTLRGMADIIVVDSAPAAEVSDALLLASAADVTLIAVRVGYTRRDQFRHSARRASPVRSDSVGPRGDRPVGTRRRRARFDDAGGRRPQVPSARPKTERRCEAAAGRTVHTVV